MLATETKRPTRHRPWAEDLPESACAWDEYDAWERWFIAAMARHTPGEDGPIDLAELSTEDQIGLYGVCCELADRAMKE